MELDNRHKTLIDLWKSSFMVHNDLIKRQSIILRNEKRNTSERRQVIKNEELFPALIAAQALLLSIFKEKIIEKDKYDNNLLIDRNKFNTIISKIIKTRNNKTYIGNIEFLDEIEAFVFLRNKLLHGEYYLKEDKIYIEKEGKETSFDFRELTDLVLQLQNYMETTLKSKNTCIVEPLPYTNRFSMKERLERNYFNIINVTIRKKGKRKTTYQDLDVFNCYIQTIKNIMYYHNISFEKAIEIFKTDPEFRSGYLLYSNYFSTNHIEITTSKIPINQHPKYEEIKQTIINDNNVFYNIDSKNHGEYDSDIFSNLIENIINDNSSILTTNALKNYILSICHYILNDGENIYQNIQQAQSQSVTFLDDISLISEFVCFYAKFHYGLDQLLSDGKNTTLVELLSNEKLDFTTLSLEEFDTPDMTLDIKLTSITEQANKIRNDYEKYKKSFIRAKEQFEKAVGNENISKQALEKIKTNLLLAKERYFKQKQLVDKLDSFDLAKYERYINIINHIRNAFAHGNVTIKPYTDGDTLKDRIIHIVDIYNGETTYEKELTYQDFATIFQEEQNITLKKFVENVATEENASYMLRDMSFELEDQEHHITSHMLDEWQQLIEQYRKEENSNELDIIILAYVQMKTIDVMKETFTVDEFCQNTINYIKYYKEAKKEDALELEQHYDETEIDVLYIYNKIIKYILKYSNNCPESLRLAFQPPEDQSNTTKH